MFISLWHRNDGVEYEVSHVVYFGTTDFRTWSNTVKAFLIMKLLKVRLQIKKYHWMPPNPHPFFVKVYGCNCKFHNARVLHIPLEDIVFQFEAEGCSLSSSLNTLLASVKQRVLSVTVKDDSTCPSQ